MRIRADRLRGFRGRKTPEDLTGAVAMECEGKSSESQDVLGHVGSEGEERAGWSMEGFAQWPQTADPLLGF